MANSIKVIFPRDSRTASIPVNHSLMKTCKNQVQNGTHWGFSMSKSRFLNENTCPTFDKANITAWIYPQFELMNFYVAKKNSNNISDCSYIDFAVEALSSYQAAKTAYPQLRRVLWLR